MSLLNSIFKRTIFRHITVSNAGIQFSVSTSKNMTIILNKCKEEKYKQDVSNISGSNQPRLFILSLSKMKNNLNRT